MSNSRQQIARQLTLSANNAAEAAPRGINKLDGGGPPAFPPAFQAQVCMTMSPVSLWWNAIVQRLFGPSQELAAKMESRRGSFRLVIRYHPNLILVGKSLEEPIMGKHFKISQPVRPHDHPVFDTTLLYIPIYCHLVLHPPSEIVRPKTPDLLIKARMEKVMDTWAD